MIHLGRFTGEIDEETGYVGVKLMEDSLFARPLMQPPFIAIPDKNWVNKYGKHYMAVVAYEDNVEERPILLGVIPHAKPKFPAEGYDKNYYVISEKFRVLLDDENNNCIVDVLDGGNILLGSKDVTEPAVLGNKNEEVLKKLAQEITNIYTALSSASVFSGDGGAVFKAAVVASLATLSPNMNEIINSGASGTKSKQIKLL